MPLSIVPTPIGNLEDITLRALRVLREADLISCEDTRRTGKLLAHYEIEGDLIAYHEHNEAKLAPKLAEQAREQRVALVTDAGTPLVSDPGYRLVRACIEAGAEIEVLPGPSALVTALVASGLPSDSFRYVGFLPRKGQDRKEILDRISKEPTTFVLFESPHRLAKTLSELPPDAPVAVCRELTKMHEEVFRGSAAKAAEKFAPGTKGEIVIVVRGGETTPAASLEGALEIAVAYTRSGESTSKAASLAARETGFKKAEIYDRLVESRAREKI